jgi:hypothetical protein
MATQFQTIKSVFNGGEMSPLMDGRTDSEKYATGCRLLENFIVRPYGGIFKRPGTRFGIGGTGVEGAFRLVAFRRSTDVNFILSFSENEINVWSFSEGFFTLVDTLTTTYQEEDIQQIHVCQINDVMFLTHGSYAPQRIIRATDGTWSIDSVPFQFAPALDPPDDAVTVKIVYDANTWATAYSYVIGDFVLYQDELYRCKTANSDVAFTLAKWDKAVYRSPWNVGTTGYTAGDVVEYFGSNYFCITTHSPATSANRPGTGAQWVLINITDYRLIASSATFDADEVGSTWLLSPGSGSVGRIVSEAIPASISTTTSAAIFIQGAYVARTVWTSTASPNQTTLQLQESLDRINFTTVREWYISTSTEGTISYTAEAPNTGGWYRWVAIKASATGSGTMTIEPTVGKLDIPFKIESYTSSTEVKGIPRLAVDSLIPNEVIGFTFPVWRKGAFSASRGYPRTVCFHDQRLWFAGTETEPMRIWGSQTDDFYTFLTGTLETSGIDVTLAATQANDIQWITSFKRTMVIGTTGEEWTMDSGEQDGALSPSNLRLRRWSRYGSSHHQPILAGDGLLWLTRDNRLREFAYVFEKDGYSAPEMTLLAEHMLNRSPVVQMAYSQSPDPIVWFVHEDGTWSGFTYDRENNVTAWHRHSSGQNYDSVTDSSTRHRLKSMCTIYADNCAADTTIYLFDRGYLSGSWVSIMQLESVQGEIWQACLTTADPLFRTYLNMGPGNGMIPNINASFIDGWVYAFYSGGGFAESLDSIAPSFTLPGRVIQSNLYNTDGSFGGDGITVSNGGSIDGSFPDWDNYASSAIVGFPIIAAMVPNRMEVQIQSGSSQMSKWRLVRLATRTFASQKPAELYWYEGDAYLQNLLSTPIKLNNDGMIDYPPPTLNRWSVYGPPYGYGTGQSKAEPMLMNHSDSMDFYIVSQIPTPYNLLALIMDVEIGGISGAAGS